MSTWTLDGSTVLKDGRADFTRKEVADFVRFAIRRKMRQRGYAYDFMSELARTGTAALAWNFARNWLREENNHRVAIRVEQRGDTFAISCFGLLATYVTLRVTRGIRQEEIRRLERLVQSANPRTQCASKKKRRKQALLLRSQARRAAEPQKRTGKRRRPATPSENRNEKIVPQFRKHHVFWQEAVKSAVFIFQIRGDGKSRPEEIVLRALHRSLERNAIEENGRKRYTFAKFERSGFVLRFDLVDGRWRGDLTPLSILATKDNAHPFYRRMRRYFRKKLGYLTDGERRARREREAEVNVIRFGGARYVVA